jgi:lipopolysaccharide/colanic/teichoic acid biosynthesis glycosyltransferase
MVAVETFLLKSRGARGVVRYMALSEYGFPERQSFSEVARIESAARPAPLSRQAYRHVFKRIVDIFLVLVTVYIWLPIILITALIVARDGHNPFYTQPRIGRNGRVFRILKLRSMVHDADAVFDAYLRDNSAARSEWNATQKLKRDPRITRVGRFIRKTSIDELPQLLNVLIGDMSLVGPRPIMVQQRTLYPGHRYYEMRPGITGFWQICNRNQCRFTGRARYDNAYFNSMSLWTDLVVIWRTFGVVLRGTGY